MERRTELSVGDPPVASPVRRDLRRFPGRPSSVPQARRHVRATLRGWDHDDLEEAGALIVTELATNAVLHAGSDLTVELLDGGDDDVVLVVADDSPALPVVQRHGREASTGRGLWLLDHFSSRRGVQPVSGGKRVWAVLCPEVQAPGEGSGSRLAAFLDDGDVRRRPV